MRTNDDTCGPTIPTLRKLGLTAGHLKPASGNPQEARKLLKDTEALVGDIDTYLGTKLEGAVGDDT